MSAAARRRGGKHGRMVGECSLARLRGLLLSDTQTRPVWLLGAGASVTSGVPAVKDLVEMMARLGYCLERGLDPDDPRPQRSEWTRWISETNWYNPSDPLEVRYPLLVERILQPTQTRKRFFGRVLREGVSPGAGYTHFAELVTKGWIRTILTTNFDDLVYLTCRARPGPAALIEAIKSPFEMHLVSTDPSDPQVTHVHGSVEHYTDCNLEDETRVLDPLVKAAVAPLLRDHPVVVMGYRGAEPSIMGDLFLDGADGPGRYPHGIYWCRRGSEDLHPHVLALGERIGSNLLIVPIEGFDEAMAFLAHDAPMSVRVQPPAPTRSPDLGPSSVEFDRLDWNGIARLLPDAAEALSIAVPSVHDRPWQEATLAAMNLARTDGPVTCATRAGELLFSMDSPAAIHISWDGTTRELAGNISELLDDAGSVLNEANAPFRLVGLPRSTDVRPYHPLAVKELLVNALAHRDHERAEPVRIIGDADHLEFRSPGGLVEGVPIDGLGKTAAAGYRNPVVASFLVGIGAMDQRGSGLVHVREWVQQDGGDVEFSVVDGAAGLWFVARLRSRPERPEATTGTAKPRDGYQVFYANALPVRFLRGVVDVAPTDITSRPELFERHPGEQTAPFVPTAGTLISLSDLSSADNPLHAEVTGDVAHIPIADFCQDPDDERHLVNLLNESFRRHAKANSMLVFNRDQRIYYPKTAEGERKIPYHGRVRDAVRTVVKVRKRADDTISYYEHEAARWRFRRFGDEWYLLLLPGWVFTRDGEENLLAPKRITSLSTRRAARDYNPNVVNHVWFWAAMLAGTDRGAVMDDGASTVVLEHNPVTAQIAGAAATPGEADILEDTIRQDELDELDIELDELVDEPPDEMSDAEGSA